MDPDAPFPRPLPRKLPLPPPPRGAELVGVRFEAAVCGVSFCAFIFVVLLAIRCDDLTGEAGSEVADREVAGPAAATAAIDWGATDWGTVDWGAVDWGEVA